MSFYTMNKVLKATVNVKILVFLPEHKLLGDNHKKFKTVEVIEYTKNIFSMNTTRVYFKTILLKNRITG